MPSNVFFLNYSHDFVDVIKTCDAFIRATTTDGDSLSVQEAMYLGKDVIASDVIDRPKGCILFKTEDELEKIISNFNSFKNSFKSYHFMNNMIELQKLYLKISK
jgi:glycosyltransferase involved in cell wall biosynthesis